MNHDQEVRYARHISLPEIGKAGQEKLLKSRVLVIGAGGLGSPVLLYLAAAGVGTIGIVDGDRVELSNLQRQIIHEANDVGQPKTESARESMLDINADINIICHQERLNADNVERLFSEYDVVADGSDNFVTRFLVNDWCYRLGKILVSAAIQGFSGQLSVFKAHMGELHPCYRCIYPDIPPDGVEPSCAEAGVLGSVAGIMGTWQATEIIKEITGAGKSLSGSLVIFDALNSESRKVKLHLDPKCNLCGDKSNATGS